jgi:hypothetical protein
MENVFFSFFMLIAGNQAGKKNNGPAFLDHISARNFYFIDKVSTLCL